MVQAAHAQKLGRERSDKQRMVIMNEYGQVKRCAKGGAAVAVLLIGAVGAEALQYHQCRDVKADAGCRAQDDLESRHGPYRPANLGLRLAIATTTSASTSSEFVSFQGILK